MKKFLTVLATVGFLSTSAATGLLSINQTTISSLPEFDDGLMSKYDKYATVYNWENVAIDHSVETNALGIDVREDTAINSKLATETWDTTFKESRVLVVSGYFALHPYEAGIYLDNVLLYLNPDKSNDLVKIWDFEQTNDKKDGLSYQMSQIKLSVTAQYNESDRTTSLTAQSYIYAKTSMTFYSCSTTAQINNIMFLSN